MDTAVHDAAEDAELAALRRRAFGPDADILDDPAALARLQELEESVLPPPAQVPAPASSERRATGIPLDEDDDLEAPKAARLSGRLRDRMARFTAGRLGRITSILAAVVLIGAVGGAIGWQIGQPHPDRVLHVDGTHYTPSGQGTDLWLKEMYGITGSFRGHEPYGRVHVFTGTARDGSECMVLMIGADDAVGTSCSPPPLPASADLFIFPGWTKVYTGLELPAGSVVRFVQSGDDVEVWTAIMPTSPPTL